LKNETTPLKSVTPAVLEEKQNFGNETNVETKCLQSPSKKWYEQLTESEQKKQKENETNIIKTKEKITFVLEEKKMLEKIEKILYQSGPSSFKKTSSQFNEILASTKRSEYKSLVSMFIKDLVNTNDPKMISRIKTFLETKDFLSANTFLQYEFILMHHGAMIYNQDVLIKLKPLFKSDYFLNLSADEQNEFNKSYPTMEKLYSQHEKVVADRLQAVGDEKMKSKIKRFQEQQCLYDLPEYKYEYFIRTIGIILYGCGGHYKEL